MSTEHEFKTGDRVLKSGYPGTVTGEYMTGVYEVRLRSGSVVVPGCELTLATTTDKD